jgi:hypothetical protein
MKKEYIGFFMAGVILSVLLIISLATGFWKLVFYTKTDTNLRTRVITPQDINSMLNPDYAGQLARDDNLGTRVPLEEEEIIIAILNKENEEGLAEEQFAVYYIAGDPERKVYITYIVYESEYRRYSRIWNAVTAAERPETITIFSQDIIGDRSNCVIVTGMNQYNEHTMTIFRRSSSYQSDRLYNKIAEIQIDGSIVIQETNRSLAYQQGITSGQSFNIAAYGHDNTSDNMLDQIESIYSYISSREQYEMVSITRIPGSQVEQRRLREVLSGERGVFENFINDLWYYVSPQGTIDAKQYLYFDPSAKEIIFFGDEAQQIFSWQNSTSTRYGLYIRSQNISISTLLRFIDIELVSLDSIRIRVTEDVRLRITASTTWDGTYRRAGETFENETASYIKPAVNALYDSTWGRLQFFNNSEYTITQGNAARKGRYVFYHVDNHELLELRPTNGEAPSEIRGENRMVYKIESIGNSALVLSRVRIGTTGVQDLFEPPVTLTPAVN